MIRLHDPRPRTFPDDHDHLWHRTIRVSIMVIGLTVGFSAGWLTRMAAEGERPAIATTVPLSFTDADTREVTRWRCRLFDDGYEPRLDKCVQEEP